MHAWLLICAEQRLGKCLLRTQNINSCILPAFALRQDMLGELIEQLAVVRGPERLLAVLRVKGKGMCLSCSLTEIAVGIHV